jgi:peptidoglycan-associated lipoprotein
MNILTGFTQLFTRICIVSVLALTGCAQTETAPDKAVPASASASAAKQKNSVADKPGPAQASIQEIKPDYAHMNPVPITFEKLSVKLRDSDKQILALISERAQKARKLVVTGFCDRQQVGNARASANARAAAIKIELVRLGVKPNTIHVKSQVDVANKHAAEIQFG